MSSLNLYLNAIKANPDFRVEKPVAPTPSKIVNNVKLNTLELKSADEGGRKDHSIRLLNDPCDTTNGCKLRSKRYRTALKVSDLKCFNDGDGNEHLIESARLKIDPNDPTNGRKLCERCYQIAYDQLQAQKKCSNDGDGNEHIIDKSIGLLPDPDARSTRKLCQICHSLAMSKYFKNSQRDFKCANARDGKEHVFNIPHKKNELSLCDRCYSAASGSMAALKDARCFNEGNGKEHIINKIKKPKNDPDNMTRTLCQDCYRKALRRIRYRRYVALKKIKPAPLISLQKEPPADPSNANVLKVSAPVVAENINGAGFSSSNLINQDTDNPFSFWLDQLDGEMF